MTYPYQPPDAPALPTSEIGTLVGLLRGGTLNTAEDFRCANAVYIYGAATLVPVPTHLTMIAPMSTQDAADHLESLTRPKPGPAASIRAANAALPWGQILNVVISLVQAWLAANAG